MAGGIVSLGGGGRRGHSVAVTVSTGGQNGAVLILEGHGVAVLLPLGIHIDQIAIHSRSCGHTGLILVNGLGVAGGLAAFLVPAGARSIGVVPLILRGSMGCPAEELITGTGEGILPQGARISVDHGGIFHGAGTAVGVVADGIGLSQRLPLGVHDDQILVHSRGLCHADTVGIGVQIVAGGLAAFLVPAAGGAVGIVPLILSGSVSIPAQEFIAVSGVSIGAQLGVDTVVDQCVCHGTGTAVGVIADGVGAGLAGGGILRQLLKDIAVKAGNAVMVGVGVGHTAVGVEVQLAVAGGDVAALDLKQCGIGTAGDTEDQSLSGEHGAGGVTQVKYQNHTAVELGVIAGKWQEQGILIEAHALGGPAGQIQILTLDVHSGAVHGAQLGQCNIAAGGAGADGAGVQVHAVLDKEGDLATGHAHDGQAAAPHLAAVVAEAVAAHLAQVAGAALVANNGAVAHNGAGDEQVGGSVDTPHVHIIGMAHVGEVITAVIGVIHFGGCAGVLIGHGDEGPGFVRFDFDAVQHLGADGQTLHTGAGAVVLNDGGIGIVAIEQVGSTGFGREINHGYQKQRQRKQRNRAFEQFSHNRPSY